MELIAGIIAVIGTILGLGAGVKKLSKDKQELKGALDAEKRASELSDEIHDAQRDDTERRRVHDKYDRDT